MLIKKGTELNVQHIKKSTGLNVQHTRKGNFLGVAMRDFDTADEWYPIKIAPKQGVVYGLGRNWSPGEVIPCRASFTRIDVVDKTVVNKDLPNLTENPTD